MWGRIFSAQDEGATGNVDDEEIKTDANIKELQEQIQQQNDVIEQMKVLLRENEVQCNDKDAKLNALSTKFQKFQLQSKAKIANLTNQLKDKPPKKDEGEFDDASSSDSSEYSSKGKILLLRKQLDTAKQQLDKSEKDSKEVTRRYEQRILDLESELNEKNRIVSSVQIEGDSSKASDSNKPETKESGINEMYAQIVYKDSKILDLNNQILEQERRILDLQEHIKEKDEVLQSRNLAVHLISADMSRKGKSVSDELEETRNQMKILQSNFVDTEMGWKSKLETLITEIKDLKTKYNQDISDKDALLSVSDSSLKKVEAVRYELAARNAELQKKIVLVEEKAEKQCDLNQKQLNAELQKLKTSLEEEKNHSANLQKSLSESTSQSESKILKARVKERTKFKALERELAALKNKNLTEEKTEEITHLQEQVALLEEEKGTLQLRLIEVDEQIAAYEELKLKTSELEHLLKKKEDQAVVEEERAVNLEKVNTNLTSRLLELEANNNKLKLDVEEINNLNLSLVKNNKDLLLSNDELKTNADTLHKTIQELTISNEDLVSKLLVSDEEGVSLNMRIIELEEIQEREEKQNEDLAKKLSDLETARKESPEHQLIKEKEKLLAKCEELSNALTSTEELNLELSEQVRNLQVQVTEAEHKSIEMNSLKTTIDNLQIELEEKQKLVDHQRDECAKLREDKTAIEDTLKSICKMTCTESIPEFCDVWQNLNEYHDKLNMILQEKKELHDKLEVKEQEISSYVLKIKNLEDQVEQGGNCMQEKDHLLGKLTQQIKEYDERISNLTLQHNENVDKLNIQIQEKCHQISLLEEQHTSLTTEANDLKQYVKGEADKTESKVSSLLEQISDLDTEIARLNDEISNKCNFEKSLKEELKNTSVRLEELTQTLNLREKQHQEDILLLQEKLAEVTTNSQSLEENRKYIVDKYEKELRTYVEENNSLNQVLATKEQCVKSMNEALESLQAQVVESKKNASCNSEELIASKQQASILQEAVTNSKLQKEQLNTVLSALEMENKKLQDDALSSEKKITDLNHELEAIQVQFDELTNHKEKLLAVTQEQNKELTLKCALETENQNLKERLSQKQTEFENFLQSNEIIVAELKNTISDMILKSSSIQSALDSKQAELDDFIAECEIMKKKESSYHHEHEGLLSTIEQNEKELDKNQVTITSLNEEIAFIKENSTKSADELNESLCKASKRNKDLENYIESMKQEIASTINCGVGEMDLEQSIRYQSEICSEFFKFKDEWLDIVKDIDVEVVTDESDQVFDAVKVIQNIKKNLILLNQEKSRTKSEIQSLNDQIYCINNERAKEREDFQIRNLDLVEDKNICLLSLNTFSSQIVNIEEENVQRFQTMSSKMDRLYHALEMFSLCKEQIRRLYISNIDHESILREKAEHHLNEMESLRQCFFEERRMLSESIHALNAEIGDKTQQLETATEQLNLNLQTINSLKSEIKTCKDLNEQLKIGMIENQDNYINDFTNFKRKLIATNSSISSLKAELFSLKSSQQGLSSQYKGEFTALLSSSVNQFNQICQENTFLTKSMEEYNNHLKILDEKNFMLSNRVAELTNELDKANSCVQKELSERNALKEEEDSNITALNKTIETLKLQLEETNNEKRMLENRLNDTPSENYHLKQLENKYCKLKAILHTVSCMISSKESATYSAECFDAESLEDDVQIMVKELPANLSYLLQNNCELKKKDYDNNELVNQLKDENNQLRQKTMSLEADKIEPVAVQTKQSSVCEDETLQSSSRSKKDNDVEGAGDSKSKFQPDKTQIKLRIFKIKSDKLSKEVQELTLVLNETQTRLRDAETRCQQLDDEFSSYRKKKDAENEVHYKTVQHLKQENTLLISNEKVACSTVRSLQDVCDEQNTKMKQLNDSYLCLELKLRESNNHLATLKDSYNEARHNQNRLLEQNRDVEGKLANLKEHTDMLMNDNETYQSVVEKLNQSKSSLEKEIQNQRDSYIKDIEELKSSYDSQLQNQQELLKDLHHSSELFKTQHETKLQELIQQNVELSTLLQSNQTEPEIPDKIAFSSSSQIETNIECMDTQQLKIDTLNNDLKSALEIIESFRNTEYVWKIEQSKMESHYQQVIHKLEEKCATAVQNLPREDTEKNLKDINNRLEMELQQALSSLHKQGLRCEELSVEVSKLIEERNFMKMKLSQNQQQLHQLHLDHQKEDLILVRSSESPSSDTVTIVVSPEDSVISSSSSSSPQLNQAQKEIAALHQRLLESERVCKELRKANEALDGKLIAESAQRRVAEEELGYAQRQLLPMEQSSKDEYHLLLGDFDEPEMLVETNFSINRKVKSHAQKFRRWLSGRRMYLHKAFQRKKYSELLYVFYLFAVHLWLLLCLFQH